MKNFPPNPEGQRGAWHKKVNAAVAAVTAGLSKSRVVELLGDPDEIRVTTVSATAEVQHLMESVSGGPTLLNYGDTTPIEEVLVYNDPYRTRAYCYGMCSGRIQSIWIQDTRPVVS